MTSRLFVSWLLSGALLSSCGNHATDSSLVTDDAGAPGLAFDMKATLHTGEERYVCQFVQMPASGPTFVGGGAYTATDGTHHFLLFRTAAVIDPPPVFGEPVDCFEGDGVMRFERGFVSGGQLKEESADFPAGAALAFAAGEVLLMQGHFLNVTSGDVSASIHVDLHTVAESTVQSHVGTFRFYDPYIYVPPHGTATARMRCPLHHDVTILSAGSHMHARGVGYRAYFDPSADSPAKDPFFTTESWQNPPYWRGSLQAKAGSDIRFECDYANHSDHVYTQGLSADADEMCMFSAFYYPEADGDDDCYSGDMHGSGNRTCAQTNSCLSQCDPQDAPRFTEGRADVGACWQKCITDSCPNVTAALFPQLECTQASCGTACATFGQACTDCVIASCKPELDACQALDCQ